MNKEKIQFIVRCPLKNDIEQLERISDLMLCIDTYFLTDLISDVSHNLNDSLQKLIREVEDDG